MTDPKFRPGQEVYFVWAESFAHPRRARIESLVPRREDGENWYQISFDDHRSMVAFESELTRAN